MGRSKRKTGRWIFVVILGLFILANLVLFPMLIYRWRVDKRSEAEYKVASLCTGPVQSGCLREIDSVVLGKYSTSHRGGLTHYLSLSLQDPTLSGKIPIWWKPDNSLYSSMRSGDHVVAVEWDGQIVAIHGPNNSTLQTEYDPTYKLEGFLPSLFVFPMMTAFLGFIEYKLIRSLR